MTPYQQAIATVTAGIVSRPTCELTVGYTNLVTHAKGIVDEILKQTKEPQLIDISLQPAHINTPTPPNEP